MSPLYDANHTFLCCGLWSVGTVKVWDLRQREKPVITVRSGSKDTVKARDVWCVAFGK